jgi:ribosomal protein S18 acetylase RimI-like enzyme
MVRLVAVKNKAELNADVRQIYEESFPEDERRDWLQLADLITNRLFNFSLIYNDQNLIGIAAVWDLADFIFVEHFAIRAEERGKGFGNELVHQIISNGTIVLLEVEHPISEIAKKRIRFYERLNFRISDSEYFQPPYSKTKNIVKMLLMSYPEKISEPTIQTFVNRIYEHVYGFRPQTGNSS